MPQDSTSLAHFVQPDSIIPGLDNSKVPKDGIAWDHYAYVNFNPIIANDPTGHKSNGNGCSNEVCDDNVKTEDTAAQVIWDAQHSGWKPDYKGIADFAIWSIVVLGTGPISGPIIFISTLKQQADKYTTPYMSFAATTDDDAIVYQYQKNFPKPGKNPTFSNLPREGESGISCQYGPACNNDPTVGYQQAFGAGKEPKPGEYYRQTTIGDIRASGRTPSFDQGELVDNKIMPPGHLTIYGDSDPALFQEIWEEFPFVP